VKISPAQLAALQKINKRDWPAGEPREHWINLGTFRNLLKRGLISRRPGSDLTVHGKYKLSHIIDLTDAGREILERLSP
jgi:hypothetical protein